MKITERRLRSIIRRVIKESLDSSNAEQQIKVKWEARPNHRDNPFDKTIFNYCINDARSKGIAVSNDSIKIKYLDTPWNLTKEIKKVNKFQPDPWQRKDHPDWDHLLKDADITLGVFTSREDGNLTWHFKEIGSSHDYRIVKDENFNVVFKVTLLPVDEGGFTFLCKHVYSKEKLQQMINIGRVGLDWQIHY